MMEKNEGKESSWKCSRSNCFCTWTLPLTRKQQQHQLVVGKHQHTFARFISNSQFINFVSPKFVWHVVCICFRNHFFFSVIFYVSIFFAIISKHEKSAKRHAHRFSLVYSFDFRQIDEGKKTRVKTKVLFMWLGKFFLAAFYRQMRTSCVVRQKRRKITLKK